MSKRKGISLIVLIVTIIVMIIIAGAIIISLTQTNVIDRGEQAIQTHNQESIEEAINLEYQNLLLLGLGKVNVEDLTQKIEELSNTYKEIQNVTAGNEKVVYTLSLTGKEYQISTKTGKIEERVGSAKVPFAYYIEDGPYYYIGKLDNGERVITISRETSTINVYAVAEGKIDSKIAVEFELLDKVEGMAKLGVSTEAIKEALGVPFDDLNDEVLMYEEQYLNVFKSNYTEMVFTSSWFTLDTNYVLPTE